MTRRWLGLISRGAASAFLLGAALAASAQEGGAVRVRGEVAEVNGREIAVRTPDGGTARLRLSADAHVYAMTAAKADAIVPPSVIGAVGVEQADERLKAATVVIFPQELQGSGEGYLVADTNADTAMRHGEVRSSDAAAEGRVVTLYYPQGGATVVIPPDASVVALQPGDASLLKKGAHVLAPAVERQADGTLAAEAIVVGKEGLVPPM